MHLLSCEKIINKSPVYLSFYPIPRASTWQSCKLIKLAQANRMTKKGTLEHFHKRGLGRITHFTEEISMHFHDITRGARSITFQVTVQQFTFHTWLKSNKIGSSV